MGQIFSRSAFVGLANDRLGSLAFGNQYDFMFETLTLGQYDGAFLFGGPYDFRQGPFAVLSVTDNPTGSFDFDRMAGNGCSSSFALRVFRATYMRWH
ncbi:hypothetical protein [Paraburkholderia sediminicola]|uniref:hypothetical protein n=1 Tax=Paraburkholderia sediminicola TaxID=458836 RepID=UPI0038BD48A0